MEKKTMITKATRVSELLDTYPWLKETLSTVSDKFKLLNTPMGKIMLKKATLADVSKKSGIDADVLISKLTELIHSHEK